MVYQKHSADSFLHLHKIPYWIFAPVWIVTLLTGLWLAVEFGATEFLDSLTPGFIRTLLTRHDWLTIIWFPIVWGVPTLLLLEIHGCYRWFCRRIFYAVDGDSLVLADRRAEHRIPLGGIKQAHLRIGRRALFPLRRKSIPSYKYCELTWETVGRKQTFCSIPYRNYSEPPDDFKRLINTLRQAGLRIKTTRIR